MKAADSFELPASNFHFDIPLLCTFVSFYVLFYKCYGATHLLFSFLLPTVD